MRTIRRDDGGGGVGISKGGGVCGDDGGGDVGISKGSGVCGRSKSRERDEPSDDAQDGGVADDVVIIEIVEVDHCIVRDELPIARINRCIVHAVRARCSARSRPRIRVAARVVGGVAKEIRAS